MIRQKWRTAGGNHIQQRNRRIVRRFIDVHDTISSDEFDRACEQIQQDCRLENPAVVTACFSAIANFVGSGALGAIGVVNSCHLRSRAKTAALDEHRPARERFGRLAGLPRMPRTSRHR